MMEYNLLFVCKGESQAEIISKPLDNVSAIASHTAAYPDLLYAHHIYNSIVMAFTRQRLRLRIPLRLPQPP